MFERYTTNAGHTVVVAQERARLLGHHYIGTEHLLLALVDEAGSVAADALAAAGVTRQAARQQVLHAVGEGWWTTEGFIEFNPDAKRALMDAVGESRRRGDNYTGTAHLLLSLLGEANAVARLILVDMGVDSAALERHVVMARNSHRERPRAAGPTTTRPAPRTLTLAATGVRQRVLALTEEDPVRSYHYLLALFDDPLSVAAKVLTSLNIDRAIVEQRITEIDLAGTTDAFTVE